MKVRSFSVLKWVIAAVMVLGIGVAPLQASQYLGEVTWNGQDDVGHTFIVKAGISRVGGSYYEIQGQVPDSPEGLAIFAGGGVLVGDNVIFSVSMTLATQSTAVMQVTINRTIITARSGSGMPVFYLAHGDERLDSWSDTLPMQYPGGGSIRSSLWNWEIFLPLGRLPSRATPKLHFLHHTPHISH